MDTMNEILLGLEWDMPAAFCRSKGLGVVIGTGASRLFAGVSSDEMARVEKTTSATNDWSDAVEAALAEALTKGE